MKTFIGHIRKARAAFTLMEVNLAIFIMAVGVLAMTSLYPLGFRESQQSRDDVRAAVAADEVLGKLISTTLVTVFNYVTRKMFFEDKGKRLPPASQDGGQPDAE